MEKRKYSVVGVTFENRQEILSSFFKNYKHGKKYAVSLEKEDGNPYDSNAISVYLDIGNDDFKKVGYISKNDNVELRGVFDSILSASLLSIGPNSKSELGISIEIYLEDLNGQTC